MEDPIEALLQEKNTIIRSQNEPNHRLTLLITASVATVYGFWAMFVFPRLKTIPLKLKVPYVPSSKVQTENVMKLLKGRKGSLADLGSGDGRLVFAAASLGFQSTGFEVNPVLLTYARFRARWNRIPSHRVNFVNSNFWKVDLSQYDHLTVFLAPPVVFKEKVWYQLDNEERVANPLLK